MLSDADKSLIQKSYSQWIEAREATPRRSQRLMIAEVARTLSRASSVGSGVAIAAIEAGTGTGKTLAYLIPSLVMAKAQGLHLVVSTATISLQEQLLHKDLPDLQKNSGLEFSFALAKGRGRYVCHSKLMAYEGGESQDAIPLTFQDETEGPQVTREAWQLYREMANALVEDSWDGDRDSWPDTVEQSLWAPLTSDHLQCTGRKCPYIKECIYFNNREKLEGVDLVVANHDLVMADLALGGGAILTAPDETLYVFDEAHQLPDKAQNHFGHKLRVSATRRWLDQLTKGLPALAQEMSSDKLTVDTCERLVPALEGLSAALEDLYYSGEQLLEDDAASADGDSVLRRFPINQLPATLAEQAGVLALATVQLEQLFSIIAGRLQNGIDGELLDIPASVAEPWYGVIGQVQARLVSLLGLANAYREADAGESVPDARWLLGRDFSGGTEYEFTAVPVVPDELLRRLLWDSCAGAILTSASLTALGSFDRYRSQVGIPDGSTCSALPSPFNHHQAAELVVPAEAVDPADSDAHTAMLCDVLPAISSPDKGTLVLFTSRRQMQAVYEAVPASYQGRVLNQDMWTKQEILRRHRLAIDEGRSSVIFGLASFAEGIDLPGAYCVHVVITRIPFSVPNDPLEASTAEWLTHKGGHPFRDLALPDASRRLLQASGRLLRTEADTGKISILDKRIITRRYGKDLLAALPNYRLVTESTQAQLAATD